MARFRPAALDWLRRYDGRTAGADGLAAVIVTIMLVPQSLAYAMLAGLPPAAGLYASILPLIAYAAFGSSRTLAVGPVAVISLMTAAATAEAAAATGIANLVSDIHSRHQMRSCKHLQLTEKFNRDLPWRYRQQLCPLC